jgi:hypothetical protein
MALMDAEHYGMPVRVVSAEGFVAQFPDCPFAEIVKELVKRNKRKRRPGKYALPKHD